MSKLSFVKPVLLDVDQLYRKARSQSRVVNQGFRKLDVDWPDASSLIRSLCEYLTEGLLCDGRPLLYEATSRALIAYEESVSKVRNERLRLNVFLDALLPYLGEELAGIALRDTTDGAMWRPDLGDPLLYFIEERGRGARLDRLELVRADVEADDVRAAILDGSPLPVPAYLEAC